MKLPKSTKKYCKKCKKYTPHKLAEAKRKTPSSTHPMGYGSKKRAKKRGVLGTGNKGKYSKPPIKKWKMAGKKQSKNIDLRFKCGECKKSQITTQGWRAKKVEFA
ncbi:50S ribosomal protein L44e [Candidatus Woesearchaeota archaeon]|nr:50S ribosomal protein L44e [Candidatus Woesearchaeota archaeon]